MALKETYPSWGDMLGRGATTFWEDWEGKLSLLHSSYLYVGTWFIEGLAGIKTDLSHPGFQRFILKPGIVEDPSLRWVKAHHDCLYGRIVSNWNLDERGAFAWQVTIPPNTMATVVLPTVDEKMVTEGGRPLTSARGIKSLGVPSGQLVLEVQPGVYEFKSAQVVLSRP